VYRVKTNYKTLQNALRTTGAYETPLESRPSRPARKSTWHALRGAGAVALGSIGRCCWLNVRGKFNYENWAESCMNAIQFAEGLGAVVTMRGFAERAAHPGPVVYVSNHMSTFETVAYPTMLNSFGKIAIILKKSLADIPIVGPTARAVGCIPVTRKNAREDLVTVLEVGALRLREGHSVVIFPQGTRQAVFEARRFNSLGAKLAERAGVPLVAIAAQTDFMQTGKLIKDFGPIDPSRPVRFECSPLFRPELGAKKMHEQSVQFIASKLSEWGLPVDAK